jgi:hypothetical protein
LMKIKYRVIMGKYPGILTLTEQNKKAKN